MRLGNSTRRGDTHGAGGRFRVLPRLPVAARRLLALAAIPPLLTACFATPAAAHGGPPPDGASGLNKKVLVIPFVHQQPYCPVDPDPTGPCEWVAKGFPAPPRHTPLVYEAIFNTQVNDYYLKSTHGKTSFQFEVAADPIGSTWFTAPHNINEYVASGSNTVGVSLGQDAMAIADQYYNLSEWSRIVVLHNFPRRGGTGSTIQYGGGSWPIVFMLEGEDDGKLIALLSHELGHTLGLPDLYGVPGHACGGTAGCGTPSNFGTWGLMADDTAFTHFSGYSKFEAGWIPNGAPNAIDLNLRNLLPFSSSYTLRNLAEPGQNLLRIRMIDTPSFFGYYVECRTRKAGFGDENIPEEGVLVSLVDEGWPSFSYCQRHASILAVSNVPSDICDAAMPPGETFFSSWITGLSVTATGMNQDECAVQVTWNGGSASIDPAILGAQKFDSPDIWVDSPINGWDNYGPTFQAIDVDGAPIGPGDPAWPGQTNRIYFRVWNFGTSNAENVTVEVGVSQPLTIGLFCQVPNPAQIIATKTIPVLPPSVQSGPVVDYVEWASPTSEPARIEVHVVSTPGEITQANNMARDAVQVYFPPCPDPDNCPVSAYGPTLTATSEFCFGLGRVRAVVAGPNLPFGWDVRIDPLEGLVLPGSTLDIRIDMTPPEGGAAGGGAAGATGAPDGAGDPFVVIPVEFQQTFGDLLTGEGGDTFEYADGIDFIHYFLPAAAVDCFAAPDAVEVGEPIDVSGSVTPPVAASPMALEYITPAGESSLRMIQTDAAGGYGDLFTPDEPGDWMVRALWAAEESHGNAESLFCPFVVTAPCTAPASAVSIAVVELSPDGAESPVLHLVDPNPAWQVTGYNIYRTNDAALAQAGWTVLAIDAADEDAATAGVQWTDRSGDLSPTGLWIYRATSYNAPCAGEGPW